MLSDVNNYFQKDNKLSFFTKQSKFKVPTVLTIMWIILK